MLGIGAHVPKFEFVYACDVQSMVADGFYYFENILAPKCGCKPIIESVTEAQQEHKPTPSMYYLASTMVATQQRQMAFCNVGNISLLTCI